MKILIIHPKDSSTRDFKLIYSNNENCEILNSRSKKIIIKKLNDNFDIVFFIGHGTNKGLVHPLDTNEYLFDKSMIHLLKNKKSFLFWCNSNQFVFENQLDVLFSSGMFISDRIEAHQFNLLPKPSQINESNLLISLIFLNILNSENLIEMSKQDILKKINDLYISNDNNIIDFNRFELLLQA